MRRAVAGRAGGATLEGRWVGAALAAAKSAEVWAQRVQNDKVDGSSME